MIMKKSDALVNAQSVFSWAVFFGHGTLHQLTSWCSEMELTVHFPYGEFNHEREDNKFRSVVVAGAKFDWSDRDDLKIEVLSIKWHYSE